MISTLKRKFGDCCTGLKVNISGNETISHAKQMRFCEVVKDSFKIPILINTNNLSCLGSRRSLGLQTDCKELTQHISTESGVNIETVEYLLHDTPYFSNPVHNILLGINQEMEESIQPDLYIMYIKPRDLMNIVRDYTIIFNKFPIVKPHTFLSVCGNVLARTLLFDVMSISFGCPESRRYGGVKDHQVVVGIPYNKAIQLF
jgi:uncharacterized protein (DUF169 family)